MEYFNIGRFVSTHGVKGELLLQHSLGKKSSLKGLKAIFLEQNKNELVPWFVESTKIRSEDATLVKLEGVDTREAATRFLQQTAWITDEDNTKFSARRSPRSLLGYLLVDNGKELGDIKEVIEQPQQVLCRLDISGKEVLVPLHEASLRKIDHKNRRVNVELPEGLLDIYLGKV